MMIPFTVKDSGRKLFPHSDVWEGGTGEGDIMQSKQQKKRSMECEDSSASWEVGKFEGRNEKKQSGCYGNIRGEVGTKW